MRKRIVAACVCLLCLSFLWLFSCTTGNNSQPEIGQEEEIVIKWLVFGDKYKASDYVFAEFNQKLQEYFPNTRIEFEVIPKESYKEKWDMKMAANETVDLAWMGTDLFNFAEEVKKGSLMALNFLLSSHGQNLKESIDEELWERQVSEGNTYGIPIMGGLYRKQYALTANKNDMERYGNIEEIGRINRENQYTNKECYEVFETYLGTMKKRRALGKGVSYQTFVKIADKGYEGIYGSESPFVIKIYDEDWKVYNKYELESYRLCFERMSNWYQKGYIRKDIADTLNPGSDDGMINGSIFFLDEYGESGTAQDMIQTEYEEIREPLEDTLYIGYSGCRNSIVIPKSAEYPGRAMEIMDFLSSDEGKTCYRLLANGVEKEHYVQMNSSYIARMAGESEDYLYMLSPYTIGNVFQNYQLDENEFDMLKANNKQAVHSGLTGFELDTRMIAIEMAKVELVVEEYMDPLCQGISEDWEVLYSEFVTKMKEAGSDKVIQEMQRQIDEFKNES